MSGDTSESDLRARARRVLAELRPHRSKVDAALLEALRRRGLRGDFVDAVESVGRDRWTRGRARTRMCGMVYSRAIDLGLAKGWAYEDVEICREVALLVANAGSHA